MYSGKADPTCISRLRDELLIHGYVSSFIGVEVRDIPGAKRRGLFATRDFSAGEVIMSEAPVVWQFGMSPTSPLYAPNHTPDELDGILYQLSPFFGSPLGPQLPPLSRADLTSRVMRENSFGVGAVDPGSEVAGGIFAQGGQGRAVYPGVAMANHSCTPCARAVQEGGAVELQDSEDSPPRRTLEARRNISSGEEITIAYVPVTWMKKSRVSALQTTWGFVCTCPRCSTPFDDTQALKCSACGNGRVWGGAEACADCSVGGHRASGEDDDTLIQNLCAPGRPRELVDRLIKHPTHCLEDMRLFLTALRLLEVLTPAPSLAKELKEEILKAVARMPFLDLTELGLL